MIDQALTAALVGAVMGLIKLVEYLVKRNSEAKRPIASPYNGHCPHSRTLEKVCDKLDQAADKLAIVADRLDRET